MSDDISLTRWTESSPELMIKEFRAEYPSAKADLSLVLLAWPVADELMYRLARYFSPALSMYNKRMFDVSLYAGVFGFITSPGPDYIRLRRMVYNLIHASATCLNGIQVTQAGRRWTAGDAETFSSFFLPEAPATLETNLRLQGLDSLIQLKKQLHTILVPPLLQKLCRYDDIDNH